MITLGIYAMYTLYYYIIVYRCLISSSAYFLYLSLIHPHSVWWACKMLLNSGCLSRILSSLSGSSLALASCCLGPLCTGPMASSSLCYFLISAEYIFQELPEEGCMKCINGLFFIVSISFEFFSFFHLALFSVFLQRGFPPVSVDPWPHVSVDPVLGAQGTCWMGKDLDGWERDLLSVRVHSWAFPSASSLETSHPSPCL